MHDVSGRNNDCDAFLYAYVDEGQLYPPPIRDPLLLEIRRSEFVRAASELAGELDKKRQTMDQTWAEVRSGRAIGLAVLTLAPRQGAYCTTEAHSRLLPRLLANNPMFEDRTVSSASGVILSNTLDEIFMKIKKTYCKYLMLNSPELARLLPSLDRDAVPYKFWVWFDKDALEKAGAVVEKSARTTEVNWTDDEIRSCIVRTTLQPINCWPPSFEGKAEAVYPAIASLPYETDQRSITFHPGELVHALDTYATSFCKLSLSADAERQRLSQLAFVEEVFTAPSVTAIKQMVRNWTRTNKPLWDHLQVEQTPAAVGHLLTLVAGAWNLADAEVAIKPINKEISVFAKDETVDQGDGRLHLCRDEIPVKLLPKLAEVRGLLSSLEDYRLKRLTNFVRDPSNRQRLDVGEYLKTPGIGFLAVMGVDPTDGNLCILSQESDTTVLTAGALAPLIESYIDDSDLPSTVLDQVVDGKVVRASEMDYAIRVLVGNSTTIMDGPLVKWWKTRCNLVTAPKETIALLKQEIEARSGYNVMVFRDAIDAGAVRRGIERQDADTKVR
jgi:hypothetical protein